MPIDKNQSAVQDFSIASTLNNNDEASLTNSNEEDFSGFRPTFISLNNGI